MKIDFQLDQESEIDSMAILGTIRLTGDIGEIEQENTYIDSWLFALVKSLNRREGDNSLMIDLVDEPDSSIIQRAPYGLTLKYRSDVVKIPSEVDLRNALLEAGKRLLQYFETPAQPAENKMLIEIKRFVDQFGELN